MSSLRSPLRYTGPLNLASILPIVPRYFRTRLKIGFYGDEENSEQIFIIPFRDGDDVKYFVVRGVSEGDRCVMRCGMVRIMDWDQLIDYLGDVWEELWDATIFKLKVAEASML